MIMYGLETILTQHQLLFPNNLLGTALIVSIFVLQFLLLVYISTLFIFFIPIIAIENKGVIVSLEQSILLVWNHFWRVLSVQLFPWICYLIFLLVIQSVFGIDIHVYFFKFSTHTIMAGVLNLIMFAIFVPWVAATLLRTTKRS